MADSGMGEGGIKGFLVLVTLVLGIIIAGFQIYEYSQKISDPNKPTSSNPGNPTSTQSIASLNTEQTKQTLGAVQPQDSNNQTSAPSSIPTQTAVPTLTFTPSPVPTETPKPAVGDILYEENWASGLVGWGGDETWKVIDGMLINTGESDRAVIRAPYRPGDHGIMNYAIEVEIQAIGEYCGTYGAFGRTGYWGGIRFTACYGPNQSAFIAKDFPNGLETTDLQLSSFNPGNDWHLYRLEMKGNNLQLFVDGRPMVEVTDNSFLEGGDIGLWSDSVQLSIRNFKVIAQ